MTRKITSKPPRFNLWVAHEDGHSVVCYGDQSSMNRIARRLNVLFAYDGIEEAVHVLPDGQEPGDPPQSNTD